MACSPREKISIENAWIPEAPPSVQALAGYMDIENHLDNELVLSGADSPVFSAIELHRTVVDEGTGFARMVEQTGIKIAPGKQFSFQPGGYHLMFLQPSEALRLDQSVPVTLYFNNGQHVETQFTVRKHELKLEGTGWF